MQEIQLTRQTLIEINENLKKVGQTLVRKFSEGEADSSEDEVEDEPVKPVSRQLPKLPPKPKYIEKSKMKRQTEETEDFDEEESDLEEETEED